MPTAAMAEIKSSIVSPTFYRLGTLGRKWRRLEDLVNSRNRTRKHIFQPSAGLCPDIPVSILKIIASVNQDVIALLAC